MNLAFKTAICILQFSILFACAAKDEVSYSKDIVPILRANCQGCHRPDKMKGKLDLTSFDSMMRGGKHGIIVKAGESKSEILKQISGKNPKMPPDEPLSKDQVALIEKWVKQGAKNDGGDTGSASAEAVAPASYRVSPVVTALAYSPDGSILAVSGYREVVLHKGDGSEIVARLPVNSPRIESLAFSIDGKLLACSGGAPAQYGLIQVWEVATKTVKGSYKIAADTLYGVSFSPDATQLAFGCADNKTRVITTADGKEVLHFDNHADWSLATTFTMDGKRIVSGSRDRAMKLIAISNAQFIDDINKLLDPITCIARNPKKDEIVYGGALGMARMYKISDNQGRTAANNDTNLLKEFERQSKPLSSIAFNADGTLIAFGTTGGDAKIFKTDGTKVATLAGHAGAVYSIGFHPGGKELSTGCFDGKIRTFDTTSGILVREFSPVPMTAGK